MAPFHRPTLRLHSVTGHPTCRIVPVLMGNDEEETVQTLADALLSVLPGRRAVVIASSDLSHYPQQEDALRVDGLTLAAIETGDPQVVRTAIATSMSSGVPNLVKCACGEGPILVTMRVAAGLGANTNTLLGYANSADSPYGSPEQVVGYGAIMFWDYVPPRSLSRSWMNWSLKSPSCHRWIVSPTSQRLRLVPMAW